MPPKWYSDYGRVCLPLYTPLLTYFKAFDLNGRFSLSAIGGSLSGTAIFIFGRLLFLGNGRGIGQRIEQRQ